MECARALAHVNEFVDGELLDGEPLDHARGDHACIDAHLRSCVMCAPIARQLAAQRMRLRTLAAHDAVAPTRAPARLVERVRASLAQRSA